jgi:hypothetical protein
MYIYPNTSFSLQQLMVVMATGHYTVHVLQLVVEDLKHGHENVTILSQSMVEKIAVIEENLLSTDHVLKNLALVNTH